MHKADLDELIKQNPAADEGAVRESLATVRKLRDAGFIEKTAYDIRSPFSRELSAPPSNRANAVRRRS